MKAMLVATILLTAIAPARADLSFVWLYWFKDDAVLAKAKQCLADHQVPFYKSNLSTNLLEIDVIVEADGPSCLEGGHFQGSRGEEKK